MKEYNSGYVFGNSWTVWGTFHGLSWELKCPVAVVGRSPCVALHGRVGWFGCAMWSRKFVAFKRGWMRERVFSGAWSYYNKSLPRRVCVLGARVVALSMQWSRQASTEQEDIIFAILMSWDMLMGLSGALVNWMCSGSVAKVSRLCKKVPGLGGTGLLRKTAIRTIARAFLQAGLLKVRKSNSTLI